MSDIWPDNLVEELAYRRCLIFLGSGISATAKNDRGESPDTWGEFLNNIKAKMKNPKADDTAFVEDMLQKQNYLLALQAIADLCDSGEYSNYLKNQYLRGRYKHSKVHELIKDLDSKIVVTTNFDKLYESLCHEPEYLTFDYTNTRSIIGSIKAPENLIIKAHGSIDDTEKLIFTAKQYYQAQEKHPEFYHLLTALFLTHTVVFLGYSLNDPDINLLLQFLHNTANSSCPHYMVDKAGNKPQLVKHWKDTYNVSLLEYGDDYSYLESSLEELRDRVFQLRADRGMP
ncbi:MAG: SIR2 family protein [Lachnospiraceae bacterium]|nr:SIR2 family protein [Lachnospiraceae bacterium]